MAVLLLEVQRASMHRVAAALYRLLHQRGSRPLQRPPQRERGGLPRCRGPGRRQLHLSCQLWAGLRGQPSELCQHQIRRPGAMPLCTPVAPSKLPTCTHLQCNLGVHAVLYVAVHLSSHRSASVLGFAAQCILPRPATLIASDISPAHDHPEISRTCCHHCWTTCLQHCCAPLPRRPSLMRTTRTARALTTTNLKTAMPRATRSSATVCSYSTHFRAWLGCIGPA